MLATGPDQAAPRVSGWPLNRTLASNVYSLADLVLRWPVSGPNR